MPRTGTIDSACESLAREWRTETVTWIAYCSEKLRAGTSVRENSSPWTNEHVTRPQKMGSRSALVRMVVRGTKGQFISVPYPLLVSFLDARGGIRFYSLSSSSKFGWFNVLTNPTCAPLYELSLLHRLKFA